MDIIRYSIERPVAVIAIVIMAVLFGILALTRIPVQLAPDVRKPIVVVETKLARCRPGRDRARNRQPAGRRVPWPGRA